MLHNAPYQKLTPVSHANVTINDRFWKPKLDTMRRVTLKDAFSKFMSYRNGAMHNFEMAAAGVYGEYTGTPFHDGIFYGMLCAASNFLATEYDAELDVLLDGYIARILSAQLEDGFLNTFTTLACPERRWGENGGNCLWQSDLYNAGTFIEASVHHYAATGKTSLLRAAIRFADLLCDTMGPSPKKNIVPEHPIVEEALMRLYNLFRQDTGATAEFPSVDAVKYLQLARFWLDNRGNHENRPNFPPDISEVAQDHKPFTEQDEAVGHAVRAVLFFSAVAALASSTGEKRYFEIANRLWENVTQKKMHISGGVGAVHKDEKFGPNYLLPSDGYLETCAAVGMVFWNFNMGLFSGDAKYFDALERSLINGVLPGLSYNGTTYFYQNPLVSGGGHHRWEWHKCPCCPPMLLKLMSELGSLIYAHTQADVIVNLYATGSASLTVNGVELSVTQETMYPWDGHVKITLNPTTAVRCGLKLRIPGWCDDAHISVNGNPAEDASFEHGYACVRREWHPGDFVELELPMPVQRMEAHPYVEDLKGMVALQRGPVLYCVEETDNPGHMDFEVPPNAIFEAAYQKEFLGGLVRITGKDAQGAPFRAIPYYAWDNREPGRMRVWLSQGGSWRPQLKAWDGPKDLRRWAGALYAPLNERSERA